MSCENVLERISLLLDGKVPEGERENVLSHTRECRECGTRLESLETQRKLMRRMAEVQVPDALSAKLRVMASHERERQLARVSVRERARRVVSSIELAFDNLMRPIALPFTGGLISTILTFGLLMPTLSFSHTNGGYQFTTLPQGRIVTNPWDQAAPVDGRDFPRFADPGDPASDYLNVVNLTIDEYGKVAGWSVVRGELTDEMKSIILLGRFIPATNLGVNTSGVIQVRQSLPPCKYTRCSVTVRG